MRIVSILAKLVVRTHTIDTAAKSGYVLGSGGGTSRVEVEGEGCDGEGSDRTSCGLLISTFGMEMVGTHNFDRDFPVTPATDP